MSYRSSTSSHRDPQDWAVAKIPKAYSNVSSARSRDTDLTVRERGSEHGRSSISSASRGGESRGGRSDRARSIASGVSDSAYSEVTVTTARERGRPPKEKKYRYPETDLRPDNGYQQFLRQPHGLVEMAPPGAPITPPIRAPGRLTRNRDDYGDDHSDADTVRPEDSASQVSTKMSSKKGGSSNGRSSNGRSSNGRSVDRHERSPERYTRPHGLPSIREGYIYKETKTVTKEVQYGWKR